MKKLFNLAITSGLIVLMGLVLTLLIPVIVSLAIYDLIKDEYSDEEIRQGRHGEDWPNTPNRNR